MENTQQNQPVTTQQTAENTTAAQPVNQTAPKNKPPYFLFLLIGLIIIFGAAIFLIQNKDLLGLPMNQINNQTGAQVSPTSAVKEILSPTMAVTSSPEEQEVEGVIIDESVEADFQEVDQDLQELQGT